jgi:polyphenol oxidase
MPQQTEVKIDKNRLLFGGSFSDKLVAAFSNRSNGNMSLNYADTVNSLANRRNFLDSLGIGFDQLICAQQVHSANVKRVGRLEKGAGALAYETALADTDALITDQGNLPLAIFTADCFPVFIFDPQNSCIGLVHAGWRGTYHRIVQKTLQALQVEFHTQPENVRVQFGPAIRSCCYQVRSDFEDKFSGSLQRREERLFLDLASANRQQLELCGVKAANIADCAVCTSCHNAEFFSYRKEDSSCGRMMSVMMLIGDP